MLSAHNRVVRLVEKPDLLLQWLLVNAPVPLMLAIFLAVAGLMTGCFMVYHLYILTKNLTTYELHKRGCVRPIFMPLH